MAMGKLGATDYDLAQEFEVAPSTISVWQAKHEAFAEAVRIGKESADDRVERCLYQRAVGYTYEAEKVFNNQGEITRATTVEHVPPDVGAVLAELVERHPTISIVVLSTYHDRNRITRALDLGAIGFIPKSAQREVMLSAFNLIFSGGVYVPPEILGPGSRHHSSAAPLPPDPKVSAAELGLSERQMEVLALMMQGKSNKAICRVLGLAEATVKIHVSAILKALKVANRTEAVIAAGALGLGPKKDDQ
jgi:DNA-binding NarL/FixJ family response regulator